jgi:PAS domain S-box-containing protein
MNNSIQFELSEFSKIFPFYILFDENLTIQNYGPSIEKIAPNCKNTQFFDSFTIERPLLSEINFSEISAMTNQLVLIKSNTALGILLKGQFNYLADSHQIVFSGAAWFDSTETLNNSGLNLLDFAPHNSLIDLLDLLKKQEIVNDELKQLVHKLNEQKKKLIESQNQLVEVKILLEENNKRYEYVNKATSEAIWDWNIQTGEIFYGDGFEQYFGYLNQNNQQCLDVWNERIHLEDHDQLMDSISKAIDSEDEFWKYEYRYLKSDGNYAFVSDKGFIVRNANGVAINMIGAMRDITNQKNEELRLKLLQFVATNTNDGILILKANSSLDIIYVNEAYFKLSGYSESEILGKTPFFISNNYENKEISDLITNNIKNQIPFQIQLDKKKKNGILYWIDLSMNPVFNDDNVLMNWVLVERDISDRIKISHEIEKQKKFNEDILNNIPTDIAVFSPDHNYLFLNKHAIKNDEIRNWMINKNDFDYAKMKGIDDSLAKKRWNIFEDAVDQKKTIQWVDEHKKPDGKTNYVLRNFYPYFEKDALKFVIGYGLDITERKLIEIQLSEALESIQKTNNELEQFAYVASHDLQEPLRMVTSFLSQLEKKYGETLDEKAKEYIYYAVDGAKRMRHIILDLLEYSRAGKSNEKLKDIDINDVMKEIEILYSQQILELNASIIKTNLPVIHTHKTPIRQVFQNLISNALKYHKNGIPPEIKIECYAENSNWHFVVSDNGIGIEPAYHEKIFIIFQRLHSKEEYSGTGIGLAITKKIIESIGGTIWLNSEKNKGCAFHFTIPI